MLRFLRSVPVTRLSLCPGPACRGRHGATRHCSPQRSNVSTSGHFIRGFFTLGVGQVLSWIGAIALTVVLPRQLDDVNLGKFAFAMAFTQLVGLVADLGTPTYLTKELAR